jgi:ATP phosphoribosyltransferase
MNLLAGAGIEIQMGARNYRPTVSMEGIEAKLLKPQNIVEMLHAGSRELGFAGADWVEELDVDLVELVDTGMDPVRLVAAAPEEMVPGGKLPDRPLVVASEYERLTRRWIEERGLDATFVHSYGATEVFPPEDADCIVDNTATGSTLRANGLAIVDTLMLSSTRLYANPKILDDRAKREVVDRFVLLIESVLAARRRVMIEVNVDRDKLEEVVAFLPCMREPTISPLRGEAGFAVKAAVPRGELTAIVPELKARGGSDIVVTELAQIIP